MAQHPERRPHHRYGRDYPPLQNREKKSATEVRVSVWIAQAERQFRRHLLAGPPYEAIVSIEVGQGPEA